MSSRYASPIWCDPGSLTCNTSFAGGVKQASHLLKYDSMLGTFPFEVKAAGSDGLSVDGKIIKVVSSRDPTVLPWGDMDIDLVIEGTGVFVTPEGAGKHLQVGLDPNKC